MASANPVEPLDERNRVGQGDAASASSTLDARRPTSPASVRTAASTRSTGSVSFSVVYLAMCRSPCRSSKSLFGRAPPRLLPDPWSSWAMALTSPLLVSKAFAKARMSGRRAVSAPAACVACVNGRRPTGRVGFFEYKGWFEAPSRRRTGAQACRGSAIGRLARAIQRRGTRAPPGCGTTTMATKTAWSSLDVLEKRMDSHRTGSPVRPVTWS